MADVCAWVVDISIKMTAERGVRTCGWSGSEGDHKAKLKKKHKYKLEQKKTGSNDGRWWEVQTVKMSRCYNTDWRSSSKRFALKRP